ncbi:MAG: electron transport complex subunit RsxC [Eubacteriales bacterium]|nr:electron transport complex subunit RsxC [Eubacteriales bacterium]
MLTFRGGVHPYDGKDLTMNCAIQDLDADDIMVFPMVQHLGAPANPMVKRGERVLVGQIIGEASGFISANVVSSVSGKVKAVEPRVITTGAKVMSVVVENDREYEAVEGYGQPRDWKKLSNDEIRRIIKDAGIVGMGGAGFPANVKLMPGDDEAIEYIIINGAECEPYLTSDYRLMLEEPERLIGGLEILLHMFPNAKAYIGIEKNKPQAIELLEEMTRDNDRIIISPLKTKYPQGGERMLIYAITKRKVHSRKLPKDAGCIVHNVDTCMGIYRAVAESIPSIKRIVTVSGDAVAHPCNFRVYNGTKAQSIIDAAGGYSKTPFRIIAGGPMMGMAQHSMEIPATKNLSALLVFTKKLAAHYDETNCIRCGKCVNVCPEFLAPVIMMNDVQTGDFDGFEKHNGMECIECGSCAYICPARRKLTQNFKLGKLRVGMKRRAEAEKKKKEEAEKKAAEAAAAEDKQEEATVAASANAKEKPDKAAVDTKEKAGKATSVDTEDDSEKTASVAEQPADKAKQLDDMPEKTADEESVSAKGAATPESAASPAPELVAQSVKERREAVPEPMQA